jgi:hypothetical protein
MSPQYEIPEAVANIKHTNTPRNENECQKSQSPKTGYRDIDVVLIILHLFHLPSEYQVPLLLLPSLSFQILLSKISAVVGM